MLLIFDVERAIPLELDLRRTKEVTAPRFVPQTLEGRFSLAKPVVVALTSENLQKEPEVKDISELAGPMSFDLVSLSCTFHRSDSEPFEEAWIGVKVSARDKNPDPPVVWSMRPLHDTDLVETTAVVKLETGIKLASQFEPKVAIEGGEKTQKQAHFLAAFGLQQSDSYWHFHRTQRRELIGSYRLVLIVKRPKGALARGVITAKASVRKKTALFFTYNAATQPLSGFSFNLG